MSSATEKSTPAKPAKAAKAKKPAVKSTHPSSSAMVEAAIGALKERKGSSLIAIKKYIATNYKVDPVKQNHFIKKALTNGVEKKSLVRVKGGVGATGSFKLAKVEKVRPKKKAATAKKPSSKKAKTPSKPKKKTTKPKSAKKATKKVEKPKTAKKSANPKKPVAKKASKSPAAKKPAKKAAPKKK